MLCVVFGSDKEGGAVRFSIEMTVSGLHPVGMFSTHDSHENMEQFHVAETNWFEQSCNLICDGLMTHTKEERRVPVYIVIFGDRSF